MQHISSLIDTFKMMYMMNATGYYEKMGILFFITLLTFIMNNDNCYEKFEKNMMYIVDNFTQDCDYLWWVDSDFEIIPRDTLNLLIECDKDVVIPTLTNEKYEYHDCGSVVYNDDSTISRFQYINTDQNLIKLIQHV